MAEPRGKGKASRKRTFTSHSIDDILGTKEPDSQPRQTRAPTRSSPSIEEASSSDNSGQKNPKKKRITYTRQQKDALESYFHQVGYPDTEAREQIAQAVGIDQEKVQVWFQNRRAKCRKRELPLQRQQWYYTTPDQYAQMIAQQQLAMTPQIQDPLQAVPTSEEQGNEATATETSTA